MKKLNCLLSLALIGVTGINASVQTTMQSTPKEKPVFFHKPLKGIETRTTINPNIGSAVSSLATRSDEGGLLNENFEEWNSADGEKWLPEGWTTKRITSASGHKGWRMYAPMSAYDEITSKCLVFESFKEPVDEWVITPSVAVADGMELRFFAYPSPLYYYDWSKIDWETYTFTEMSLLNDFKINISEDGGNSWTLLKSLADDFKDITGYFDLYYQMYPRLYKIDLSKYAGKNVMIGFQIEGNPEGNLAVLDDVYVGYPPIELSYSKPEGALFFGLSSTDQFVPASIMTVPVYQPVTFENKSKSTTANYSWIYMDTDGEKTSQEQKALTVTYKTDYTDEFTTRNNLYDMPVLTASDDKFADTEFTYPYLLQAGGKGEYERYYTDTQDKEVINLGLGVVDPMTEGTATYADIALPYFGYNNESDRYWTDIMLNGDKDFSMDENTYCKLLKNGNLFYATDAPLVITGVHTNGYGRVSRNAVFKAEIFLIGKNWQVPDTPYATAICTGDDITIIDRYSTNNILSFNFKFDEPIVMSKELTPYYFVAISGFNDPENVEYYSPEMSDLDNPDRLALGWIGKELKFNGQKYPVSWSPVQEYTRSYVAFYIMLDAVFPWLESESEDFHVSKGETIDVKLDSYYDGDELKIENMPSWLTAKAEGRYGETKVNFTCTESLKETASVTITAPGVAKTINIINGEEGGVDSIYITDLTGKEAIYTLTGIKVRNTPKPGIYIIRNSDGTVSKKYLR